MAVANHLDQYRISSEGGQDASGPACQFLAIPPMRS